MTEFSAIFIYLMGLLKPHPYWYKDYLTTIRDQTNVVVVGGCCKSLGGLKAVGDIVCTQSKKCKFDKISHLKALLAT